MSNFDAVCASLFIPTVLLNITYWSSVVQASKDRQRERQYYKDRANQALEEWLKKRKKHGV